MVAQRKRVLVVDDSPTALSHAISLIQGEFELQTASTGVEGFQKIQDQLPDAVILDLEMPEMNGVELLRMLKQDARFKALPVLVSTTVTEVEKVNECRRLGCNGFVLKPLREEYILAKLRNLTARKV